MRLDNLFVKNGMHYSIFNILNKKYLFSSEIIQTCKQVMVTQARYVCVYASCAALRLNMTNSVHSRLTQEGYIEELSTQGLVRGAKVCLNPYFFGWLEM